MFKCQKCGKKRDDKNHFVKVLEGSVWKQKEMVELLICKDCEKKFDKYLEKRSKR